jgi:hypothetical protein
LNYGKESDKRGALYDIRIEGDAIAAGNDVRSDITTIDKGWLVSENWPAKEFKARKSGTSTVRIFVKPDSLQEMKLDKELRIRVE